MFCVVDGASGARGNSRSPRRRNASRLVTSIRSPGQADNISFNSGAAEMICSKLSNSNNTYRSRRNSWRLSSNKRFGDSITPRICAIVGIIRVESLIAAREIKKTPSTKASCKSWTACRARLVLPTPPGPVMETRRGLQVDAGVGTTSLSPDLAQ